MIITDKLYWQDPYLREFTATVVKIEDNQVWLDRTCFYPQSGGQAGDCGWLQEDPVTTTKFTEEREIVHIMEHAPTFAVGSSVTGRIDWDRRYKIMKLHSASHIMENVLFQVFPNIRLAGTNVDDRRDSSTYYSEERFSEEKLREVERKINEILALNLPIETYEDPERAGYRHWRCKEICIPCGGTHPRSTEEIGAIAIRRESGGRGKEKVITSLR